MFDKKLWWKNYYAKNKKKIRKQRKTYDKLYYQKNKEKILKRVKKYSERPEVKKRISEYHKKEYQRYKDNLEWFRNLLRKFFYN